MKARKTFKDLTKDQKYNLIQTLETAANTADFLKILINSFDLENNKPGMITKKILADRMVNLVMPMINPDVNDNL